MKHGRKPTRQQKIYIKRDGHNYLNWLVVREMMDKLIITHRETGTIKDIPLIKGRCRA